MVDAGDLKSPGETLEGSIPSRPTSSLETTSEANLNNQPTEKHTQGTRFFANFSSEFLLLLALLRYYGNSYRRPRFEPTRFKLPRSISNPKSRKALLSVTPVMSLYKLLVMKPCS